MFVQNSDDPLSFTGGFKKMPIIARPMMSLWFIGTFCTNFISYQLETWQMLADNQHNIQMQGSQNNSHRKEQDHEAKSYITTTHLNPINCAQRSPKDDSNLRNPHSSMKTSSIDGEYRLQHQTPTTTGSIRQTAASLAHWRPDYSIGNGRFTKMLSLASAHPYNPAIPGLAQSSFEDSPSFDGDRYLEQHCPRNLNTRIKGVQGQGYATIRPQTSMDERSEYLARGGQLALTMDSPNPQGPAQNHQLMCHRRRNASYSSPRTNISGIQAETRSRPSTGTLIAAANHHPPRQLTLISNCSPQSSSGSLPASLQRCNWHSYLDDYDCSIGEPVSLPLTKADRKAQQTLDQHHRLHQPLQAAISQLPAAVNGHPRRHHDVKTQYRWQQGPFDLNTNQRVDKTVFVRQVFNQSIDKHKPLHVGSDSELYSRSQQAFRRNLIQPTKDHRSQMIDLVPVPNQANSRQPTRNKNDNFRSPNQSVSTVSSLQVSSNITRLQPSDKGLSKKGNSNNSDKLSIAGAKRRLGFKQKTGLISLSVQRSEEVIPLTANRQFLSQMTNSSFADSATDSGSIWTSQQQMPSSESIDPSINFVDGLGAGQVASRQALVSPYLGDIQLTLSDRRGMLEVEVVRARGLQLKPGAKTLPSPYVKLYLMKNKKCLAKSKTLSARRTQDPLYQQQFIFREDYTNCILQVIVWGDYGKKDRKSLMGIVQIRIDDLDISNLVIDWYRMFNAPSMANSLLSSRALRQMILTKTQDTN